MVLGKHPLVPNPTQPCTPAQPIIWEVWAGIGAFVSHPKSPWGWAGIGVCAPTLSPRGDWLASGSLSPTLSPHGDGLVSGSLSPT